MRVWLIKVNSCWSVYAGLVYFVRQLKTIFLYWWFNTPMGRYFRTNIRMKYAMVFEHPELKLIFANADDSWIKLEHAEAVPMSIQTLCDTLT